MSVTMQGVGIDMTDIGFFRQRPYATHTAFYDLVFTEEERQRCLTWPTPEVGFALHFAVKEAAVKALSSCGNSLSTVAAIQVEVAVLNGYAMPLRLRSRRGEAIPTLKGLRIHASCSATSDLAAAIVTVSPAEGKLS